MSRDAACNPQDRRRPQRPEPPVPNSGKNVRTILARYDVGRHSGLVSCAGATPDPVCACADEALDSSGARAGETNALQLPQQAGAWRNVGYHSGPPAPFEATWGPPVGDRPTIASGSHAGPVFSLGMHRCLDSTPSDHPLLAECPYLVGADAPNRDRSEHCGRCDFSARAPYATAAQDRLRQFDDGRVVPHAEEPLGGWHAPASLRAAHATGEADGADPAADQPGALPRRAGAALRLAGTCRELWRAAGSRKPRPRAERHVEIRPAPLGVGGADAARVRRRLLACPRSLRAPRRRSAPEWHPEAAVAEVYSLAS
jgi:hypothetical protein